jgi:hypothetical protein
LAASINSGVTLDGGGAAARTGSANSAVAASAVDIFNTSRLDQFRSRMVPPLLGRLVADRHGECWHGPAAFYLKPMMD